MPGPKAGRERRKAMGHYKRWQLWGFIHIGPGPHRFEIEKHVLKDLYAIFEPNGENRHRTSPPAPLSKAITYGGLEGRTIRRADGP